MGYKCLDCGNTEKFIEERNYDAYGWERNEIDGEGDWLDTIESEETDRSSGDQNELECSSCGSSNVEWKDGEWDEEPAIIEDWREEFK